MPRRLLPLAFLFLPAIASAQYGPQGGGGGGGGITSLGVGSVSVTGGQNGSILYDSGGRLGEISVGAGVSTALGAVPTGTGGMVLATNPNITSAVLITPTVNGALTSTGGINDTSTAGIVTTGRLQFNGSASAAGTNVNGSMLDQETNYTINPNGAAATRERYTYDTVTNNGTTNSIDEGWFFGREFVGTGTYPDEVNGFHVYMTDAAGTSFTAAANENFEASTYYNGAHNSVESYLGLMSFSATGTLTGTGYGFTEMLSNSNPTANSIKEFDGFNFNAMSGGGSFPQTYTSFRNRDQKALEIFYAPMTIGNLGNGPTTNDLSIYGPDNSSNSNAIQTFNQNRAQTFRIDDAQNAYMGGNLFLGINSGATGAQDGALYLLDAQSAYRVGLTTSGTLTASTTLTLPNVNDTVAVLGAAQTFTGAETFNTSVTFGASAAIHPTAATTAATCASGALIPATAVVTNGIITTCG